MSRQLFRLAGSPVKSDTLLALQRLSMDAEEHELVGSILIPLYKGKIYFPITTGWAADNHTLTAGILNVCMVLINERAIAQSIPSTKS